MKITYHAAATQDGFIADDCGGVDWLNDIDIQISDTGIEEFMAGIDGLVMGRATYDFVFQYGSWPYGNKPSWVLTSQKIKALPGANLKPVTSIEAIIEQAKENKRTHLWLVGGGKLASSFVELGLLNHVSVTELPVTLGTGIPLFARHSLASLTASKFKRSEKSGFCQVEVVLKPE